MTGVPPITRRGCVTGLAAAAILPGPARRLRLSHQFPGGTADDGDFRDRLARRFADGLRLRSVGALGCDVFPDSTLVMAADQFAALGNGTIDLAVMKLADAAAGVPALDIALMPGLVTGYDHAARLQAGPLRPTLDAVLARNGVLIVSWVWQALGVAARPQIVLAPEDARGMLMRGGGPALDAMLARAGARNAALPAEEVYAAFQGGRLDACVLASTDMISQRLQEVARNVTAMSDCFGFALSPLLMSQRVFAGLPPDQQAAVLAEGAAQEPFAQLAAQADDARLAGLYLAASTPVQEINPIRHAQWVALAQPVQADYARRSPECAALLALGKSAPVK